MSISERKRKEREALQNLILETAADIVAEKGYENLTIRDLASRIDYSPRTIYLYFADKQNLLEAVVEKGFRFTAEQIRVNRKAASIDPGLMLRKMIAGHIAMAAGNPNYYRAVVSMTFSRDFKPGPFQREINEAVQEALRAYIRLERERESEADFLRTWMMNSLRMYTLSLLNENRSDINPEKAGETFFNLITKGLEGGIHD
ncbi:TetR/AcrR family transcriptional regulator [Spirochaeta isovalerica]|uniref:AcrR family transcriptional regulator n=1 Tax=Spirochaeta isovalerica TaxID=150 RepID=A0A841RCH9_9SPIO|nr:TetR/AcrR family transcriptional regulator [Spirochaeta isovalerica]MBB6480937.1 AcrR family transcriptional regulator [Spirochaeta isovalerica]